MLKIPYECPRNRKDCISLSIIASESGESFFCCGENDTKNIKEKQDKFTLCFKGELRDDTNYLDKYDLTHQASVIMQSLAVIQASEEDTRDWSPWLDLKRD